MFTSNYQGYQAQPFGTIGNSVSAQGQGLAQGISPQGVDLGSIVNSVSQCAAQALPGLLMSLLSAHPQIQHLARQGGVAAIGANQQNLYGLGANPQSLYGYGSNAQSLYGHGANAPWGGLNAFNARPQFIGQPNLNLAPQGSDLVGIVDSVAQSAAQALPGLITSLLSAHPQVQPMLRQGNWATGGVNHAQNLFGAGLNTPFGGGGLNIFENRPQFGGGQQYPNVQQQGLDIGAIAQNVAGIISQQIPAIVNSVAGQVLGNQQTLH
jgi:hypothetical protein